VTNFCFEDSSAMRC